jgi:hypothetical protein
VESRSSSYKKIDISDVLSYVVGRSAYLQDFSGINQALAFSLYIALLCDHLLEVKYRLVIRDRNLELRFAWAYTENVEM